MKVQQPEDRRLTAVRNTNAPRRNWTGRFIIILIVVAFVAFGGGIAGGYLAGNLQPTLTPLARNTAGDGNRIVTQEEEDIAGVASKVGPSVVSVLTQTQSRSAFGSSAQQGAGTGLIVSRDGYVLTNKHVIQGSQAVRLVASNGATYKDVKVVGVDPLNDIAFLKINGANDLTPAELGLGMRSANTKIQ